MFVLLRPGWQRKAKGASGLKLRLARANMSIHNLLLKMQ